MMQKLCVIKYRALFYIVVSFLIVYLNFCAPLLFHSSTEDGDSLVNRARGEAVTQVSAGESPGGCTQRTGCAQE